MQPRAVFVLLLMLLVLCVSSHVPLLSINIATATATAVASQSQSTKLQGKQTTRPTQYHLNPSLFVCQTARVFDASPGSTTFVFQVYLLLSEAATVGPQPIAVWPSKQEVVAIVTIDNGAHILHVASPKLHEVKHLEPGKHTYTTALLYPQASP